MNKAVTLILALLLLSGMSWAANTATVTPLEGVRATPQTFQAPPMPTGQQDANLLSFDFSGSWSTTNPPSGWTIYYSGSGPDANDWYNGGGYAALYWYPYDYGQTDYLMSPTIDCGSYTNIVFSTYSYYSWFSNYTAQIQGSTDGGTSWPYTIYQFTTSYGPGTQTFNLPWAAGTQLRIRYYGTGDIYNINWWYADNFIVTGDLMISNDIAIWQILAPLDPYYAFGDSIYPKVVVKNMGTAGQNNVPIRCLIKDSVTGATQYNVVQTIPSLAPAAVCTLSFPLWEPPATEAVYRDTFKAENPGDQNPTNDVMYCRVKVTAWGAECITYNDGTFDNATSWLAAGSELAVRFMAPTKPLGINKAVVWLSGFSGSDYDAEVRVYGNDGGGGAPGTQVGAWVGKLHTSIWSSLYKNEVIYDPALSVNYDTFFVSYYQTSITPAYPYLGMDYTSPVTTGNDWGKYTTSGSWAPVPWDGYCDQGIDACYQAPLLDGKIVSIDYPPAEIDSNTTITPVVTVGNAGLKARSNIVAVFDLLDSTGVRVYSDTMNTGAIAAGGTKQVTFTQTYTPHPGYWTDSAYTIVQWDGDPTNDWFVQSLFVIHLNVKTEILSPRVQEVPGLVPVTIRLVNMGNVPAMVPRLDMIIMPSNYSDYAKNIALGVGANQVLTLKPWVCPAGGHETATAWITYAADMYPPDDTMIRGITTGIPGWTELTPLPAPPSGKPIKDGGCMAYLSLIHI